MSAHETESAAEKARRSRIEQGLPPVVRDPEALKQIASLFWEAARKKQRDDEGEQEGAA